MVFDRELAAGSQDRRSTSDGAVSFPRAFTGYLFATIPSICLIRSLSELSRGLPPSFFSHAVKSCSFTACSTGTFRTDTLTVFNPSGIPSTHSSLRIEANPKATASREFQQ